MAAEPRIRDQLTELRANVEHLLGSVSRLGDEAGNTFMRRAKDGTTRAEQAYDAVVAEGKRSLSAAESAVRNHPLLSLGLALGVGVLLGTLMNRR